MSCAHRSHAFGGILVLLLAALILGEGSALAQSRSRHGRPKNALRTPSALMINPQSADQMNVTIQAAMRNPETTTTAATTAKASPKPPATIDEQTRAWWDYVRDHPYQMDILRGQVLAYPVNGGMLLPGFGVVNGAAFGGPNTFGMPVQGGMHLPGFGVVNGTGWGNPGTQGTAVQGGVYLPGFGVVNGTGWSNPGTHGTSVNDGTYRPGFGVVGNGGPLPGTFAGAGMSVNGGTYRPGFGVVGGGAVSESETPIEMRVNSGIYRPGFGVVNDRSKKD